MPGPLQARFTCSLHFRHRQLNLWLTSVLEPRYSEPAWGNGSLRYLFENCALDTDRRELRRDAELVAIPPQVFDLLDYLIRNREHVVSKGDLIEAVWKGRIVSETALTTRLNAARSAIGDTGEEQRLIKTLPRKGLRFVGTVREGEGPAAAPAADKPQEPPLPALTLPDKPSIAVLPFENMSGDPEQDYFADGMVEDIITGLSRSRSLFVIARNSSFAYKGKAVDIKQVGRELGVRYVLEGSVRKAGNRVRITGQLVDAATGNHIWADRYDSTLEDIFDLQDRVTTNVIGAIAPQLERAEIARAQRKPTESLSAYDYYLRALAKNYRFTREANMEALKLTQTASDLDPDFAAPYALGANLLGQRWVSGWSSSGAEDLTEGHRLARRALELDGDNPGILASAGAVAMLLGELDEAAMLLARAITLDPNLAAARLWNGWVHVYLGKGEAAIEQFQIGLRMSPLDLRIYLAQSGIAAVHFSDGRFEEGSSWAKIALQQNPNYVVAHRILMACHAMAGRVQEARQAWAVAREIDPTQRISTVIEKWHLRKSADLYAEALRIAGMPE
jgi:TolB-like protein/Flp pilus assembly protein TadD